MTLAARTALSRGQRSRSGLGFALITLQSEVVSYVILASLISSSKIECESQLATARSLTVEGDH